MFQENEKTRHRGWLALRYRTGNTERDDRQMRNSDNTWASCGDEGTRNYERFHILQTSQQDLVQNVSTNLTHRFFGLSRPPTCTSKRFSLSVTFFNPAWEEKCILQPHIDHMTTNLAASVCDAGSTRWRSFAMDARPQPRSDHCGASLKMKAAAQTAKTNHYINSVTLTVALVFYWIQFFPWWVRSCCQKPRDDINAFVLSKCPVMERGGRRRGCGEREAGQSSAHDAPANRITITEQCCAKYLIFLPFLTSYLNTSQQFIRPSPLVLSCLIPKVHPSLQSLTPTCWFFSALVQY